MWSTSLAWQIELTASARKELSKLDRQAAKRITTFLCERITRSTNPRSNGKALTGPLGGLWRYRADDFRIVCELKDDVLRVLVIKIGNRREVYRPGQRPNK